jgi:phosphoglycolate phosphatase-like HAD superfamily hydrolase
MKLLLFDIDGTLLMGRGIPRKVFLNVIQRRFPDFPSDQKVRFSGMTDPQIVHDLLSFNGYSYLLTDRLVQEIIDEFIIDLPHQMNRANPPQLLPGVRELLEYCDTHPACFLGLVTGNVMQGARIKLDAVDIYHYFAVGAFGSDHRDRNQLPPIALERAAHYFNRNFSKGQVWIIGDSVKDVQCARANQLNCLAVSTGFTSEKELMEEKPDYLLPDLTDLRHVLRITGLTFS